MNAGSLPHDFIALAMVALLLGVRHGFDADHLAAIDALTRHNASARPRVARLAGVLFSLGHGVVVVGVALAVSTLAGQWRPPLWLTSFGAWMSVAMLTALGLLNLTAALCTPADQSTPVAGWRSGVFARLLRAGSPLMVMGIGSLFALSFDTVSHATLFAIAAGSLGGWQSALLLALLFVAGMLVTDGINGWWIARLVRRSDQTARIASRVMALAVAGLSLLTAALGAASQTLPAADAWMAGKELWFGAAIVAWVFGSFVLGQRLARSRPQRRWRSDGTVAQTIGR